MKHIALECHSCGKKLNENRAISVIVISKKLYKFCAIRIFCSMACLNDHKNKRLPKETIETHELVIEIHEKTYIAPLLKDIGRLFWDAVCFGRP